MGNLEMLLGATTPKSDCFVHRQYGGVIHDFYLTGEIKEASEYIEWFDTIRNSSSKDLITIHINSFGGDIFIKKSPSIKSKKLCFCQSAKLILGR